MKQKIIEAVNNHQMTLIGERAKLKAIVASEGEYGERLIAFCKIRISILEISIEFWRGFVSGLQKIATDK